MFSHIERSIREKVAQEIEELLCPDKNCLGVNKEHCDYILEAAEVARGKNEYRDSVLKEENQQIRD